MGLDVRTTGRKHDQLFCYVGRDRGCVSGLGFTAISVLTANVQEVFVCWAEH